MQLSHQPQSVRIADQQRTLRLAWSALVCFFLLFLIAVGLTIYAAWRYYETASVTHKALLIPRVPSDAPAEWVTWQPCGRTAFQQVGVDVAISPCDQIRIITSAGYGQVATLRLLDESTLDMWAGADLRLERHEASRWTNLVERVVVRQAGGYVRYDLHADQPYREVSYQVLAGAATINLQPGGSYSIGMRSPARQTALLNGSGTVLEIDVAVRSGRAEVQGANGVTIVLVTGQRTMVDPAGIAGLAVPARWDLVRDGSFSRFSEEEYNNTTKPDQPMLSRADSWQVFGTPSLPVSELGYFRLDRICRPPLDLPCAGDQWRDAAWFYRTGRQTRAFLTGVTQRFGLAGEGVDISEYRSLVFSVWVRVQHQSLVDAGDAGAECPVTVRFYAKRNGPADLEEQRVLCLYADADGQPTKVTSDGIAYQTVQIGEWYHVSFDLRDEDWLPDYRYLRSIQIFANGHDYDANVSDVSLIGTQ